MSVVGASAAAPSASVALGGVHFRITDTDAVDLAVAVGALIQGEPLICLRAVFTPTEPGGATPKMGDVVALPAGEGVTVLYKLIIGHADVHALAAHDLGPGEVLLVQLDVINTPKETI